MERTNTEYANWKISMYTLNDYVDSLTRDADTPYATHFDSLDEFREHLKNYIWEEVNAQSEGLAREIASDFLRDVDWYELAADYANDAPPGFIGDVETCSECGKTFAEGTDDYDSILETDTAVCVACD